MNYFFYIYNTVRFVLVWTFVIIWNVAPVIPHYPDPPKVLLVSFDGFRWDYLHKATNTPNFNRIIREGVISKYGLKNAFLTKTFPNHYTLVTGLYEENHGIVGNSFFDTKLNATFEIENKSAVVDSRFFDVGGEPVWVTNQKQKCDHRSGVVFWPGDGARVKGILPDRYLTYDPSVSNTTRIDTVIKWFMDDYPINLGLLYFEEPDGYGHWFGPDSPEVKDMVEALDKDVLGYLFEKLEENGLLGDIDIIITSDHGMTEIPEEKKIDLDQYIDATKYRVYEINPVATILPNDGFLEEIYKNLSKVPHLHVYKREEIPDNYHYKHYTSRIAPIVAVPDEHYWCSHKATRELSSHNKTRELKGEHGYNNSLRSMHPFFIAMGPSFKQGYSVDQFNNVDVYPLLCKILGLEPAPNNGSMDIVKDLLKQNEDVGTNTFVNYICILLLIGLVSGVFSVAACQVHRSFKRRKIQFHTINTMTPSVRYSTVNGRTKMPLISDTSEDEFEP